jgi:hypothetical protein
MDQEWLARVGLRLEAPPRHHRRRRVDTAFGLPHPGQRLGQPGGPLAHRAVARRGALRSGRHPLYNAPEVRAGCLEREKFLVASGRGPYPHTDPGVEVRRICHRLRHSSIENFNEHFKAIFDCHAAVPTKGLSDTARFALGAVFVYQLALLHRHQSDSDTNRGLKAFLRAA